MTKLPPYVLQVDDVDGVDRVDGESPPGNLGASLFKAYTLYLEQLAL